MIESQRLDRNQRLVVVHRKRRVIARARRPMEQRIGGQRTAGLDTFRLETFHGGAHHGQVLVAERAVLACVRIKAGDGKTRPRDAEALTQVARDNPPGFDYEISAEMGDDIFQRKVDSDWYDREFRGPQHHHRATCHAGRFLDQLTEIFGMSRLGEARAIEHVFGDRIGDHGHCGSGADVGHCLTNGR